MVFESRLSTKRFKPRLVLSKQFPVVHGLNLGDKGQLRVRLGIESIALETDGDSNDMQVVTFKVLAAQDIKETDKRAI